MTKKSTSFWKNPVNLSSLLIHRWSFVILILVGLTTTSCLTTKEEVTFNKDGSGNYSMTIDMSEMADMLKSVMSSSQIDNEMDLFGTMDSTLQETVKELRQFDGITNVRHTSVNYVFEIAYDFASVEALNKVNNREGSDQSSMGLVSKGPAFSWSKKLLEREDTPMDDMMKELKGDESQEQMLEMARMMMADAEYTTIYHMPGKVKKMTNESASLSIDKKTVTLNVSFLDLMDGKANVGNKIKYKPGK